MKLRIPPDCGAVSYQGSTVTIDSEGSIDVDETAAGVLAAHGFHPLSMAASDVGAGVSNSMDEVATLSRNGLFSLLRSKGVRVSLPVTNEALRAAARKALAL